MRRVMYVVALMLVLCFVLPAIAADIWTGRCIGVTNGDVGLLDHDRDLMAERDCLAMIMCPSISYLVAWGF